jgi:signal peptidase I
LLTSHIFKYVDQFARALFVVLLPGAGLAHTRRRRTAMIGLLLMLFVALLVYSRALRTPLGFGLFAGTLAGAVLLSWHAGLSAVANNTMRYARATGSALLFNVTIALVYAWREALLGVTLFYVPSYSMAPAIIPGDVILVDTRQYVGRRPAIGDVIVFERHENTCYVKRIKTVYADSVAVHGDNQQGSIPSKSLGRVRFEHIVGEVSFIAFNAHKGLDRARLGVSIE